MKKTALPRPPVVVVMGHVDHGKTTLLDTIKKTNRAQKEVGGITQSIGAYEVTIPKKDYVVNKITFIDTPGHEAFISIRAKGAQVADCAVLVVDAVDSIMPQTVESIAHIKAAHIPFIVAINKIDLPGSNPDKVKKDLLAQNVLVEGMGGDVPTVAISAKKGTGIAELLETILLLSSTKELTFDPTHEPVAHIIETHKDKQGAMVSAIARDGVFKIGMLVYAGQHEAKIKALIADDGRHLREVYPSTPFVLLGFKELPSTGETITLHKKALQETPVKKIEPVNNPQSLLTQKSEEHKRLKVIIKTNTTGSLEAITQSVGKNDTIEIVLAAVGEIHKADIMLAKITKAIVIGFCLKVDKSIAQLAEQEKVVVKTYRLIYELFDELTEVSAIKDEQEQKEKHLKGEAKILASFIIEKEKIAGISVIKGKININDQIELTRKDRLVGKAKIVSIKMRARTVQELKKNDEGGVIFYPQLDFSPSDVIKSYSI